MTYGIIFQPAQRALLRELISRRLLVEWQFALARVFLMGFSIGYARLYPPTMYLYYVPSHYVLCDGVARAISANAVPAEEKKKGDT
jgi:hypothetical protein